MAKVSRQKKFWKVFNRKYRKPLLCAAGCSFLLYLAISNVLYYNKLKNYDKPHFLISSISSEFNNIEFMHLLLTVQEINKDVLLKRQLHDFVNMGFPNPCPRELKDELYNMNWEAQAFLIRVKKMFELHKIYERTLRLTDTIEFLKLEEANNRDRDYLSQQIKAFIDEKDKIINQLSKEEYNFIEEHNGIVEKMLY